MYCVNITLNMNLVIKLDYNVIINEFDIHPNVINNILNKYNVYQFPDIVFLNKYKNEVLNNPILTFYKLKGFKIQYNYYNDITNNILKNNLLKLYFNKNDNFETLYLINKITIEEIETIKNELNKIPGVFSFNFDTLYFNNTDNINNFMTELMSLLPNKYTYNYFNVKLDSIA